MKATFALVFAALCLSLAMGAPQKKSEAPKKAVKKHLSFETKSNIGCTICNTVVQAIDEFLEGEEKPMEDVLDNVCKKLGFLESPCTQFVHSNFETIVDGLIHNQLSPEQICQRDLHACSAKSKVLVKSAAGCSVCNMVVEAIDSFLEGEEASMEQVLDEVCGQLGFLQSACTQFVHGNFENIVNGLIHEQLSPEQVCKKYLHACPNKKMLSAAAKSQVGCSVCDVVVTAIDSFLQGEEASIEQVLDGVCNQLPGNYLQHMCTTFVHNDFEKIVNGLIHEQLSPQQVCTKYLHAC